MCRPRAEKTKSRGSRVRRRPRVRSRRASKPRIEGCTARETCSKCTRLPPRRRARSRTSSAAPERALAVSHPRPAVVPRGGRRERRRARARRAPRKAPAADGAGVSANASRPRAWARGKYATPRASPRRRSRPKEPAIFAGSEPAVQRVDRVEARVHGQVARVERVPGSQRQTRGVWGVPVGGRARCVLARAGVRERGRDGRRQKAVELAKIFARRTKKNRNTFGVHSRRGRAGKAQTFSSSRTRRRLPRETNAIGRRPDLKKRSNTRRLVSETSHHASADSTRIDSVKDDRPSVSTFSVSRPAPFPALFGDASDGRLREGAGAIYMRAPVWTA